MFAQLNLDIVNVVYCSSINYFGGVRKAFLGVRSFASSISADWTPPRSGGPGLLADDVSPASPREGSLQSCEIPGSFWGWQGGVLHMPFCRSDSTSVVPGFPGNQNTPVPSQKHVSEVAELRLLFFPLSTFKIGHKFWSVLFLFSQFLPAQCNRCCSFDMRNCGGQCLGAYSVFPLYVICQQAVQHGRLG